jgi:hypothetical protein
MDNTTIIETFHAVPHCGKCESDDLRMPEGITRQDDLTDDSLITCTSCGTVTTYVALVESCEANAAKDIEDDLGSIGNGPLD